MAPGLELDKAVSRIVDGPDGYAEYSTELFLAWSLIDKIPRFNLRRRDDGKWVINLIDTNMSAESPKSIGLKSDKSQKFFGIREIVGETAPHVICLAVLEVMNG